MNIAIVPWTNKCLGNRMFMTSSPGEEVYTRVFVAEKEYFESKGYRYETIDQYSSLEEVDWILVYYGNLYHRYMREFLKQHCENKLIYLAIEPEVVVHFHESRKMRKVLSYAKYIVTWNREAIDGKRIFPVNVPYIMETNFGNIPFEKRKLLTAIYSNKSGTGKKELYSERRKIFQYFEDKKDIFDLYGYGWSSDEFHNYKGEVGGKAEIYQKYRFAIALENVKNVGGISEKIFDCLCAGVVPIYYGASDIEQYVPKEAFIDYGKFKDINEMYHFLENMNSKTWETYISAGRKYLESKQTQLVSVELYCKALEDIMIQNPAKDMNFNILKRKWYVFYFWVVNTFFARGCKYIFRKFFVALKNKKFCK